MDWHVRIGGQQYGPVTEAEAVSWASAGRFGPSDLVWSTGMDQWAPAAQIQPFASTFSAPPIVQAPPARDDSAMRWIVPIGRSGWAIAAGYLGLLLSPLAAILGIVAVLDIKKHPEKLGMGRAVFGVIMGTISIIVMVFILFQNAF